MPGGADNVAPDAMTRATQGYNIYAGTLAALTDGQYPANADAAVVFIWPTKGNLIFQFDKTIAISGLRIYVGNDGGVYQVQALSGAVYTDQGQTETLNAEVLAEAYDDSYASNVWLELKFPETVYTNYIVLATDSGAEFYEVEILTPADATPVPMLSWGWAKNQTIRR